MLLARYPAHSWDTNLLLKGKQTQQRRLEKAIRNLFPVRLSPILFHCNLLYYLYQDVEMQINVRREADLVNPLTGKYLELDIYLPSLSLAFEYQVR